MADELERPMVEVCREDGHFHDSVRKEHHAHSCLHVATNSFIFIIILKLCQKCTIAY